MTAPGAGVLGVIGASEDGEGVYLWPKGFYRARTAKGARLCKASRTCTYCTR